LGKVIKVEQTVPVIRQKKKVAAYARISMETERMNHSLSTQISYYNDLIQKNPDWEYAGVFFDNGISGTSIRKRQGFQDMVKAAEEGKIDIILTKSIQRFARNTVDLLETVRHLKDIGVEVRFEKENINSMSGDGELMLTILASFAQEESRSISENVKWGVKKKFEKGEPYGRKDVFGYTWVGDTLQIVPEEAEIVRRIFQNFLNGKSRLETEREFEEEGITTKLGCKWMDSNIRVVLTNITYTGNLLLQKTYSDKPGTHTGKNKGELPKYFVENTHEPIIDMETFQYVQEEMARRRELGPLANKSLNITCFTGKIKCESCGKSFMRNTRTNRAKLSERGDKLISWVCGSSKVKGRACKAMEIPEPILRRECAKALGIDEFDEDIFTERVDFISIPKHGTMIFHFKDGTSLSRDWENTSKKDSWTAAARKRASDYRRTHAVTRDDITCFTTKIKCTDCGCNFRKQVQRLKSGKVWYWRCGDHNGCGRTGIKEHELKPIAAEVLGLDEFDDSVFLEQIDHIDVEKDMTLVFYFNDGRVESRQYTMSRVSHPCSEKQKLHMRELQSKRWTPEKKKEMSEKMKQLRKERGSEWRRK